MIYNNSRNDITPSANYTNLVTFGESSAVIKSISVLNFYLSIPHYVSPTTGDTIEISDVLTSFDYRLVDEGGTSVATFPTQTGLLPTGEETLIIQTDVLNLQNIAERESLTLQVKWQANTDEVIRAVIDNLQLNIEWYIDCDIRKQITLVEVGTPLKWQGAYIAPLTTKNQVIVGNDGLMPVTLESFFNTRGQLILPSGTQIPSSVTVENANTANSASMIKYASGSSTITVQGSAIKRAADNFLDKRVRDANGAVVNDSYINEIRLVSTEPDETTRTNNPKVLFLVTG